MRQALSAHKADPETKKRMKEEIESVIGKIYEKEMMEQWKDVYVTDHTPRDKKYFTLNKKEDEDFFKYTQSLKEYNTVKELPRSESKSQYEKGSWL